MSVNNLTKHLAEIALDYQFDSMPENVVLMAKLAILDHVALTIRGSSEDLTRILGLELFERQLDANELIPGAAVDEHLPAIAMLRASASHAIDYDDTFEPAHGAHMGSLVVGSVLPLAAKLGASGKDIITAIVVGYEVAGRVGGLLHDDHYLKGFHATATIGVFGVASACARLLDLDKEQMVYALGLAATQASGVKSTFGTMAKPFNAGKAAYNGLLAARLAAKGFTANLDGLEADKGYLDLFLGLAETERQLKAAKNYLILENLFKFHAACHATHPMIEATKQLISEYKFSASDVQNMQVEAASLALETASIEEPTSGLECKFSFPQIAACALCGIDTTADTTFSDDILSHKLVNQTRARITMIENSELDPHETNVWITLSSGKQHRRYFNFRDNFSDLNKIKPLLEKKFKTCTEQKIGKVKTQALLDKILRLETLEQGFIV